MGFHQRGARSWILKQPALSKERRGRMVLEDRKTFYALWGAHYDAVGRNKPSPEAMKIIFNSLKKYPLKNIALAMETLLQTSKYPPCPSDIVGLIEGDSRAKALGGWQLVLTCIRKYGYTHSISFRDPAILFALDRLGSWQEICSFPRDVLPFKEKAFVEYFVSAKNAGISWDVVPSYLVGWEEQSRRRDGYKVPAWVLVEAETGKSISPAEIQKRISRGEEEMKNLISLAAKKSLSPICANNG